MGLKLLLHWSAIMELVWMERLMDEWMDGWMDGWIDGWRD